MGSSLPPGVLKQSSASHSPLALALLLYSVFLNFKFKKMQFCGCLPRRHAPDHPGEGGSVPLQWLQQLEQRVRVDIEDFEHLIASFLHATQQVLSCSPHLCMCKPLYRFLAVYPHLAWAVNLPPRLAFAVSLRFFCWGIFFTHIGLMDVNVLNIRG